jgi:hypothetical protein
VNATKTTAKRIALLLRSVLRICSSNWSNPIVLSVEEYKLLSDILNQYADNPDMTEDEAGDFDLLWHAVIEDKETIE